MCEVEVHCPNFPQSDRLDHSAYGVSAVVSTAYEYSTDRRHDTSYSGECVVDDAIIAKQPTINVGVFSSMCVCGSNI